MNKLVPWTVSGVALLVIIISLLGFVLIKTPSPSITAQMNGLPLDKVASTSPWLVPGSALRSTSSQDAPSTPLPEERLADCVLLPYSGTTSITQLPLYSPGDPDYRGGMKCSFIIHDGIPTTTALFKGMEDNYFGDIVLTVGVENRTAQIIPNETSPYAVAPATWEGVFGPLDANFDGYTDMQILNNCGGTGNCSYDFYLYDPNKNQFVRNDFLSNLGTPKFDTAKKQIHTSWNSSAADYGMKTYQFENGNYVLMQEIVSTTNSKDFTAEVKTYELKNGKMELVSATTTHY